MNKVFCVNVRFLNTNNEPTIHDSTILFLWKKGMPLDCISGSQTRWLSVAQCVGRILEQYPALVLFFTAETTNKSSLQAERILKALNFTYVKATLEFCDYVLGDLTGLNFIFQSNGFQLHRLVTEVERVVKILCQNFRKPIENLTDINVDDESRWLPLNKVYPGILAEEFMKLMLPHERESFQRRCREAVRQILQRIDLPDPVLKALKDVNHVKILDASADHHSNAGLPDVRKLSYMHLLALLDKHLHQGDSGSQSRRQQRYRKEWVKEPAFKPWLQETPDHYKARVMDHLSEVLRDVFSDSKIAQEFAMKRTKATAVVTNVIGKSYKE
ncbi:hypothetical protein Pmani_008109 [Petrolisthes manimaculis]|uniref:Uncharacterized protein n=1 Tax=Petrolisthes manimaculis TaxID=1843537 RepID=A0AAE1Q7L2_9EUCA|nr:hypothetical protein Pmani_008109 [Petrolisthes manimaculis]